MSLNQSLNIALGSMQNNQYALTVVSQNIANAHVAGYHRQRVDFETNPYTTNCANVLDMIKGMNGASIASLTGYLDDGALNNIINSNSDAQYYNTLAASLSDLEDLADSLGDNGLNGLINDFYKAAVNLEQFPTDVTIRQQYLQAAQDVCDKFNDLSKKCDSLIDKNVDTTQFNVRAINDLLQNIADTNKAHVINKNSSTTQSQLDSLLTELSGYVDISTEKNANGSYNIYIGNMKVVEGTEVNYSLSADIDKTNPTNSIVKLTLTSLADGTQKEITNSIHSGQLKASVDFLNNRSNTYGGIGDFISRLDAAADAFARELNDIQTYDDGADIFAANLTSQNGELYLERKPANQKVPMFVTNDGNTTFKAGNVKVNQDLFDHPYLLCTARVDASQDPNWQNAIGNNQNATLISATQNKIYLNYRGDSYKLSDFLINTESKIGLDSKSIGDKSEIYQDILNDAINTYNNAIGVNLDEELADMIKYQRAYEASAKIFSTANYLMNVIINMV